MRLYGPWPNCFNEWIYNHHCRPSCCKVSFFVIVHFHIPILRSSTSQAILSIFFLQSEYFPSVIMVAITLIVSVLAGTVFAQNFQLARRVYPEERANLERRNVRTLGGYALVPEFQKHCPNDMLSCSSGSYCCPMSLTCNSGATYDDACCPEGSSSLLILLKNT
jgi:hypothetical protein